VPRPNAVAGVQELGKKWKRRLKEGEGHRTAMAPVELS